MFISHSVTISEDGKESKIYHFDNARIARTFFNKSVRKMRKAQKGFYYCENSHGVWKRKETYNGTFTKKYFSQTISWFYNNDNKAISMNSIQLSLDIV